VVENAVRRLKFDQADPRDLKISPGPIYSMVMLWNIDPEDIHGWRIVNPNIELFASEAS
jgi:hypothetical protein